MNLPGITFLLREPYAAEDRQQHPNNISMRVYISSQHAASMRDPSKIVKGTVSSMAVLDHGKSGNAKRRDEFARRTSGGQESNSMVGAQGFEPRTPSV